MLTIKADTPLHLWEKMNKTFISHDVEDIIDENTGISVQSFHNTLSIKRWDPTSDHKDDLLWLLRRMGYSKDGTKMTQLASKYLFQSQYDELVEALKEYRTKKRFTLGMTFRNSPARSGGCLTGLQIVKYQNQEKAFVYVKIVEIPKKFAADLLFFNGIFERLSFSGPVTIVATCVFFWKVTAPLLVPIFGLDPFEHLPFRDHVLKKIRMRDHLASKDYAYRNEARTWEYLKPIIDRMIEKGVINESKVGKR